MRSTCLIVAVVATLLSALHNESRAGWFDFCRRKDDSTERSCCFHFEAAPEAPTVSSVAARFSDRDAVDASQDASEDADAGEGDVADRPEFDSIDERIGALEEEMENLSNVVERLATVVELLERRQPGS